LENFFLNEKATWHQKENSWNSKEDEWRSDIDDLKKNLSDCEEENQKLEDKLNGVCSKMEILEKNVGRFGDHSELVIKFQLANSKLEESELEKEQLKKNLEGVELREKLFSRFKFEENLSKEQKEDAIQLIETLKAENKKIQSSMYESLSNFKIKLKSKNEKFKKKI